MNHITQKNRLEEQLKSYKDFMPYCRNDDLQKLLSEMYKISLRIDKIREMSFDKMLEEVPVQYVTKQSKINYLKSLQDD